MSHTKEFEFFFGIQSEVHHSKMTMFANDMASYCHENSPNNLQSKLNADLAAITSWLHDNKLTLNVTKSKFMISMITRGSDFIDITPAPKETIRSIRSNTNWGLLRSFNSALTDWNSLPEDMRCLPYNAFKIFGVTFFLFIYFNIFSTAVFSFYFKISLLKLVNLNKFA